MTEKDVSVRPDHPQAETSSDAEARDRAVDPMGEADRLGSARAGESTPWSSAAARSAFHLSGRSLRTRLAGSVETLTRTSRM